MLEHQGPDRMKKTINHKLLRTYSKEHGSVDFLSSSMRRIAFMRAGRLR